MSRLDELFNNVQRLQVQYSDAIELNISLKLMNEEDRNDWEKGEFEALMFIIDKSAANIDNIEAELDTAIKDRNKAIKELSGKQKHKLILSFLDETLPF